MPKINVIFEDGSLLVLDKPAGMTVNRSDTTTTEETLQDWTEGKYAEHFARLPHTAGDARPATSKNIGTPRSLSESLSQGSNSNNASPAFSSSADGQTRRTQLDEDYEEANREAFYKRGGIVHRLDKETSGIILVAKTEDSFIELLRQFREREVEKTYTALVHGKMTPVEGEISVPVGRLPWNRKRFGIVAGGRDATTEYKVLNYYNMKNEPLTLLNLKPKTGRTHQIRVHLKYLNKPIFADELYGGRKVSREDRKLLSRQFLHASSISFNHPSTGERLFFESPLPSELSEVLSKLQLL